MMSPGQLRAKIDALFPHLRIYPLDSAIREIRRLREINRQVLAAHEPYRAAEDRAYAEWMDCQ